MGEANFHELTLQVNQFNRQYPPGTKVRLLTTDDTIVNTKVMQEAYILNGNIPVTFFEGIHGCHHIDRVKGKA